MVMAKQRPCTFKVVGGNEGPELYSTKMNEGGGYLARTTNLIKLKVVTYDGIDQCDCLTP